jgi:hypothetical protein
MTCRHCGATVDAAAKCCANCGTEVSALPTPAAKRPSPWISVAGGVVIPLLFAALLSASFFASAEPTALPYSYGALVLFVGSIFLAIVARKHLRAGVFLITLLSMVGFIVAAPFLVCAALLFTSHTS